MKKHIMVIRMHVARYQLPIGIFAITIIGTVAIFFGFVSLAATRPNPPVITKTCNSTGTSVRFDYTTPGAVYYYPRLNTIPATIEQALNNQTASFIVYTIAPGKSYKFWVHAGNGGSNWATDISDLKEIYFDCPAPISNPVPTVSVTVTPNSVSSLGAFNVTMASTNTSSCAWSRSGTYSGNWTDTSLGATSYNNSISGLAGPGNATYSFTCKNSAGVTASGSGTVTVAAVSTRPNPPTITKTCNSTGTSARFDYITSGATYYYTRLNTIPATTEQALNNRTITYINYPITPDKDYHFWVHAGNGGSNWSTDISAASELTFNCPSSPTTPTTPNPTVSVTVTPNSVSSLGAFNVSMTSTNASSCAWSRSGTYSGNWTDTSLGATSYNNNISGLAGPGNATYSFTCKNSVGVTASGSGTIRVAAIVTRPNPPIITKTCDPSGARVRFDYTIPGATLYYPRLNTIPATTEQTRNNQKNSYIYYKITPDKDYHFWVHAGNGGSNWSTDISAASELTFNCPSSPTTPTTPNPTVSVTVTPNSVSNLGAFNVTMASTNASSCAWSRSGTYSGNWTNTSLGATSYNNSISGLAGPGNATYSFTCKNSAGVTATGTGTVTVAASTASSTIELFSKDIQALTASNAKTKIDNINLLKHKSCMFDSLLDPSIEDEKGYISLLKRSKCESIPRAIETWLHPPVWSSINTKISTIKESVGREFIYGMFIAEAIDTNTAYYDDSGYKFNFSAMCAPGSQGKWGAGSCVPTTSSSEYMRYLRFIISKGMDTGIQNFLFGQTDYLDSARLLPNFVVEMNLLAQSKGKVVIFGQQPNSFASDTYLKSFDYIQGPVCIEGSNSGCNPIIYSSSVLGLKPNAIITELDWWAVGDDIHTYSKKAPTERKTWMFNKIIELNKLGVGFIKPFRQPLNGGSAGSCFGSNQWIYSSDNQYGCKDEDFLNEFLSGEVKI